MTPAAASVAVPEEPAAPRRRRPQLAGARRSGIYLLGGLLVLAAIPVFATARILDQSALRNARARADANLRLELEGGSRRLGELSDDAAADAQGLVSSPSIAHAFIVRDDAAIRRLARSHPNLVFSLDGRTVAGRLPRHALTRVVWLTINGRRVGSLTGTVPLGDALGRRLLRAAPHDRADELHIVRNGRLFGSGKRFRLEQATTSLDGRRYRALLTSIPNSGGAHLLALRPVAAIDAGVAGYRARIRYAALGSFALLALLSLLFARPILRTLSDFRRVASQAATDGLTGLANRRSFDEELALEWRRSERIGGSLALILIDIDDFKHVNDTHGHQVGDAVLKAVGGALGGRVRQLDFAARYGGEEFVILLPDTELEGAKTLARRLRQDVAKTRVPLPNGGELGVTISLGIAEKSDLERAQDLIGAADHALYDAKRRGKNRVASRRAAATAAV
jgi:diguanylate cyclase (GGDEF)-like protein